MKTMLFLSKTLLYNCLFLLKYHILGLMALGEILNFQISSKKSFLTSTTEVNIQSVQKKKNNKKNNSINYSVHRQLATDKNGKKKVDRKCKMRESETDKQREREKSKAKVQTREGRELWCVSVKCW